MKNEALWQTVSTVPELTHGRVHVWKMMLSDCGAAPSREILSKDEIKRAERFHFHVDRDRFIHTRNTLRRLLALYCEVEAEAIQFAYNSHGKPSLCNPDHTEEICFNVTHSQDVALFAVSREDKIGIDVEYIRDTVEYLKLAKRFFSGEEYLALSCLSGTALKRGFYRYWTCKEAFVKAIGTGLSFPLADFTVNLEDEERPCLDWGGNQSFSGKCTMFTIPVDDDYCASLACLVDPQQISLFRCPQEMVGGKGTVKKFSSFS